MLFFCRSKAGKVSHIVTVKASLFFTCTHADFVRCQLLISTCTPYSVQAAYLHMHTSVAAQHMRTLFAQAAYQHMHTLFAELMSTCAPCSLQATYYYQYMHTLFAASTVLAHANLIRCKQLIQHMHTSALFMQEIISTEKSYFKSLQQVSFFLHFSATVSFSSAG